MNLISLITACGGRPFGAAIPTVELESFSWGLAKDAATTSIPKTDTRIRALLGMSHCTWPCTGQQSEVMDERLGPKVALRRFQPSRIQRLELLFCDIWGLDHPCARVDPRGITGPRKGPLSTTCSRKRLSVAGGTGRASAPGTQFSPNGISPEIPTYYVRPNNERTEVAWLPSCRNRLGA